MPIGKVIEEQRSLDRNARATPSHPMSRPPNFSGIYKPRLWHLNRAGVAWVGQELDVDGLTTANEAQRRFWDIGGDPHTTQIGNCHQRRRGIAAIVARADADFQDLPCKGGPDHDLLAEIARF